MKLIIALFALVAVVSAQYVYEAPVAAVPEYPVYTYNSYAPYAYAAPYSYGYAYPYAVGYGSNKGDSETKTPTPSLTNNRAARL